MNWALEVLELDASADERAIKRAYARLLRSNRPDDDAAAFQRLHEAYQTALHWQRHQQALATTDAEAPDDGQDPWPTAQPDALEIIIEPQSLADVLAGAAPAAVAPTHPYAEPAWLAQDNLVLPPAIDLDALVARIIDAAGTQPPDRFQVWLDTCPELWSLSGKADAGGELLGRLYHGGDAIGGANFDLLATAFGWDQVGTHVDPDTLAGMRETLRQRWIWQAGNEAALALELQTDQDAPATLPDTRRCRTLLTRPWRHLQALLSAANPARLHMMRNALRHLGDAAAFLPCPPLHEMQVRFWRAVTDDGRLSQDRVLLGLIRGIGLSALWLLLPVAVYVMKASADLDAGLGWPSPGELMPLALTGTAVTLLLGMGVLPWKLLMHWLPTPAAMRLWLPLLAVAAIALSSTPLGFLGMLLGGAALWLAVRRALRASARLNQMLPLLAIGLFFAAPFVMRGLNLSYGALSGGLALGLCLFDLGRLHRTRGERIPTEDAP